MLDREADHSVGDEEARCDAKDDENESDDRVHPFKLLPAVTRTTPLTAPGRFRGVRVDQVDERDALSEDYAAGYRVMLVGPGRRVAAFDVDDASPGEVERWAESAAVERNAGFSIAARTARAGGVDLIWLTPPPETLMRQDDASSVS